VLDAGEIASGIAVARDAYQRDRNVETAILVMKRSGFSVIESIRGLMEITGLRLAEATRRVHFSEAWPELRD
jgi:hypothetical protein